MLNSLVMLTCSYQVDTRRKMEKADDEKGRPVAGFVVVMCSNGANYVVEKLRSDNS